MATTEQHISDPQSELNDLRVRIEDAAGRLKPLRGYL